MKMRAIWNMAPCSPLEVGDVSEVRPASIIRTVMVAIAFLEFHPASVTKLRHIPECCHLHNQHENLTSFLYVS
jgi:hypothetical protein